MEGQRDMQLWASVGLAEEQDREFLIRAFYYPMFLRVFKKRRSTKYLSVKCSTMKRHTDATEAPHRRD